MKVNVDSILELAKKLEKETENELNWLKINNLFIDLLKVKNLDFLKVMKCIPELILRSFLSERSKLSGSVFLFLKESIIKLGADVPQDEALLDACFKLCGRANRVFNKRGEEMLLLVAEKTSLPKHVKMLKYYSKSLNKKVRKAVYLGIEKSMKSSADINRVWAIYEPLIKNGEKDPDIEGRSVCKRILLGQQPDVVSKTFSLGQSVGISAAKKEIKTNFPFLQRVPVRTNNVQEPVVRTEEVRDSFKTYLKRHNNEMKKLFSEKIAFDKTVSTPPKKQIRAADQHKRKVQGEQISQNILEYTPRGLNKYLERYREEVQRLRVSPVNETEQTGDVKNSASLKLWEENEELFAKEMLKFKEIKVPDKFELSFDEDSKDAETEHVVRHQPGTDQGIGTRAELNTQQVLNVHSEEENIQSVDKKLQRSHHDAIHDREKTTAQTFIGGSAKEVQQFYFDDEANDGKKAKDQDENVNIIEHRQQFYFENDGEVDEQNEEAIEISTEQANFLGDEESEIPCENAQFNFFGNKDLKFENLDKFNTMTQEEFLNRSMGSASQDAVNEGVHNLIKGQERLAQESPRPTDSVQVSRIDEETACQQETDSEFHKVSQQELGEKTIILQLSPHGMTHKDSEQLMQDIIVGENGDKLPSNEQTMPMDEKSSSIKSIEVYEQVDRAFDDLSGTIPSQVAENNDEGEMGNVSRYSFLEDSFNSLGVTDDVNMPALNEDNGSSGSVFEGSCVKNRFEDAAEDHTTANKTQVGEFSNIGTVLQFNKKTLRKEPDDPK